MINFIGNRVLLVNMHPKYWNHPIRPRHPRNPWETHEYLHTLNTEPEKGAVLRGVFLTHHPKGIDCNTEGNSIKITGYLAPFNEQTEPKTIFPLEQLERTGKNFYKNGRYAGNEYAFLVKVNAVFSYKMEKALELEKEFYMHNDFEVLYPEKVKEFIYIDGLSDTKKFYPFVPNKDIIKHKKPEPVTNFDGSGRFFGPIWVPNKAGQKFNIPDITLTGKDRFWFKPNTEVKSESEKCFDIIKKHHPNHYICIHNNEKRWTWFDRKEFIPWNPKKSPNNNLEYIEDINTWHNQTASYSPEQQIFYAGRPAGERAFSLDNILAENSGKLLKTHCFVWDRDEKELYYYGITQKTFILKLVKNHYIENMIAAHCYLGPKSPFHINGKPVHDLSEVIKDRLSLGWETPDYVPDDWLLFRETPRDPKEY